MIDHCLEEAACVNTLGSYVCECPAGYSGDGINHCLSDDPCVQLIGVGCPVNTECQQLPGGVSCVCITGYVDVNNANDPFNPNCADINECSS